MSASNCGPYYSDNNNDFEILSQLCPSTLSLSPRGQSFSEFFENCNTAKLLTFCDLAELLLQGQFTELLVLDTKIRFEPSLENNWGNPLTLAQYFFDLSDDNVRGQVKAFIKILDRDFSLGARSHHSLKLFAHLMLSVCSPYVINAPWYDEGRIHYSRSEDSGESISQAQPQYSEKWCTSVCVHL